MTVDGSFVEAIDTEYDTDDSADYDFWPEDIGSSSGSEIQSEADTESSSGSEILPPSRVGRGASAGIQARAHLDNDDLASFSDSGDLASFGDSDSSLDNDYEYWSDSETDASSENGSDSTSLGNDCEYWSDSESAASSGNGSDDTLVGVAPTSVSASSAFPASGSINFSFMKRFGSDKSKAPLAPIKEKPSQLSVADAAPLSFEKALEIILDTHADYPTRPACLELGQCGIFMEDKHRCPTPRLSAYPDKWRTSGGKSSTIYPLDELDPGRQFLRCAYGTVKRDGKPIRVFCHYTLLEAGLKMLPPSAKVEHHRERHLFYVRPHLQGGKRQRTVVRTASRAPNTGAGAAAGESSLDRAMRLEVPLTTAEALEVVQSQLRVDGGTISFGLPPRPGILMASSGVFMERGPKTRRGVGNDKWKQRRSSVTESCMVSVPPSPALSIYKT